MPDRIVQAPVAGQIFCPECSFSQLLGYSTNLGPNDPKAFLFCPECGQHFKFPTIYVVKLDRPKDPNPARNPDYA